MIKVINGKTYNTDTATKIGSHTTAYPSDFHYCEDALYITKKGRFFTAGEGGPMSKYAHHVSTGGWCGGTGLIALTEGDALGWCEKFNIDPEIIVQYFELEEA